MLRADFDCHPLWDTLRAADDRLNTILGEHFADDLPNIERIWLQEEYVRSFDSIASTRSSFFTTPMLDAVQVIWMQVNTELENRVSSGPGGTSYVAQAATLAESALMQMGPWPRAYGKGGEVKQMRTLFEELLEAQRVSIEALHEEHRTLRSEIDAFRAEIEASRASVAAELSATTLSVDELDTRMADQVAAVNSAVASASRQVDALAKVNDDNFDVWAEERVDDFKERFDPLREQIEKKLANASNEFDELLKAKVSYTKLVGAIAADEIALRFQKEAKWGRITGIALYSMGFLFLAGAALPLVFLLFDSHSESSGDEIQWGRVIIRLSIGILAGSAATVVIRLGGRLINSANASKRMELELRAIGPFLADVEDSAKVDNARIDLVNKAFGKTYESAANEKDRSGDVPVTTIEQVANLVQAVNNLSGNK
jgi:hypothetical protein